MNTEFAVIFDMDGVLVDSNPWHHLALNKFCETHGFQLSEEEMRLRIYGKANKDWIPALFGRPLEEQELRIMADEKEAYFRSLFRDHITEVDGLVEFLEHLRENNIRMTIATSAPRANVDFVFEHLGIEAYFENVLDESHISKGKPDPEIYVRSCRELGLEPAQCIVFEDSISGITSALSAGTKVIGVTTTHSVHELDNTHLNVADFRGLTVDHLRDSLQ